MTMTTMTATAEEPVAQTRKNPCEYTIQNRKMSLYSIRRPFAHRTPHSTHTAFVDGWTVNTVGVAIKTCDQVSKCVPTVYYMSMNDKSMVVQCCDGLRHAACIWLQRRHPTTHAHTHGILGKSLVWALRPDLDDNGVLVTYAARAHQINASAHSVTMDVCVWVVPTLHCEWTIRQR